MMFVLQRAIRRHPTFTELREPVSHQDRCVRSQPAKFRDRRRWIAPNRGYTQTVRMQELERRVGVAEFGPDLPDTEVVPPDVGVMQQNNSSLRQLDAPAFEITFNSFVGMETVDVKKVNGSIGEVRQRLVESRAHQLGKSTVSGPDKSTQIQEYTLVIIAGMFVALPGVDGVAAAGDVAALHRLAKCTKGNAVVGAKFNHNTRTQCCDEPVREWHVTPPGAHGSPA